MEGSIGFINHNAKLTAKNTKITKKHIREDVFFSFFYKIDIFESIWDNIITKKGENEYE